jgi:gas vesicle protein
MKLTSFLIGMGVGAAAAVLLAPASGDETRDAISQKAEEGKRFAKRKVDNLRDRANRVVEKGKQVVGRQVQAVADAGEGAKEIYVNEINS